jgi:hypothetical protein
MKGIEGGDEEDEIENRERANKGPMAAERENLGIRIGLRECTWA